MDYDARILLFLTQVPIFKSMMQINKNTNLQLILGLFVFDPAFSLCLRVNKEGKASSFGDNDAILNGQIIIGEPL